jgi:hypothetical protein
MVVPSLDGRTTCEHSAFGPATGARERQMAIFWREDLKGRWPVVVSSDPYTGAQWDKAIREVLAHPLAKWPLRMLFDRRDSSAVAVDFVLRIVDFIDTKSARFAEAKLAVLVNQATAPRLTKMFSTCSACSGTPAHVRVFHQLDEAEGWLEQ